MPDPRLSRAVAMAASGAAIADVVAFALLSLAGVRLEVAQASSFSLAVVAAVAILWRARGTTAAANADLRIGVAVVARCSPFRCARACSRCSPRTFPR